MYAPFYLWSDAAAMAAFHWKGGGFEGIVRDFGRPEVHTWLPVAAASGSLPIVDARVATTLSSSVGSDLPTAAGALSNLVDRLTGQPGVAWAAAGIDPRTWQSVLFAIGDPTMEAPGDRWQVLHVSAPARPTGLPVLLAGRGRTGYGPPSANGALSMASVSDSAALSASATGCSDSAG